VALNLRPITTSIKIFQKRPSDTEQSPTWAECYIHVVS